MSIVGNNSKTQLYITIQGEIDIFELSPVDLKTSQAFEDLKTAVGNLCDEIDIEKPLKWVFTHTNPSNNKTIRILPSNIKMLKDGDEINLHFPEGTVDDIVRTIQVNERSYELYESFPKDLKAEFRVCNALLNKYPQMYKKLPLEMQMNQDVCINLIVRDPSKFGKLLPEMQENQNVCIALVKRDPSMFKELSTTMQNTSSVRETFQLYSKQESLWEAWSIKQDEESQGYIYTFVPASIYDYGNCSSQERDIVLKRFDKEEESQFPAIQMNFSYAAKMINNPKLEILLKLGFSACNINKRLRLSLPDQRTLENRLKQLGKTDSSYLELKFQECDGIASDRQFIEKLVITEPVDAIISTDKEFIHDMTIHVFNTINRYNESKTDFLSDRQQFRKVCKEYYDKIQKFEALQKTENDSLNLVYHDRSLSASEVAKLAYFSLAAYIDSVTTCFDRQEFQEEISKIRSYIEGNGILMDFLISRHKQNEFVDIELDAFKLIWEHIDNILEEKSSIFHGFKRVIENIFRNIFS